MRPLTLGIAAAIDGAVLNEHGYAANRLFAMGLLLRGMWWESTAVTDVALQAKALALRLVVEVAVGRNKGPTCNF